MPAVAELSPVRALMVADGVQVWRASLHQPAGVVDRMVALLSPDERARASRLRSDSKRNGFVIARGILRTLLGDVLDTAPELVTFSYGKNGKPELASQCGGASIHFNVSHAGDLAIFAVARDRRTGVDLEWTEGAYPIEGVAARFFSSVERESLAAASPFDRRRVFFQIWARKEAYLKGRGEGISEWIYTTDFTSVSDYDPSGRPAGGRVYDRDGWRVRDVAELPRGYVASVAVERRRQ
ncbi:MAG: 4'-phosphopantetheinyl transferase superfamily protein [Gemmatimonadaceae bacterium]